MHGKVILLVQSGKQALGLTNVPRLAVGYCPDYERRHRSSRRIGRDSDEHFKLPSLAEINCNMRESLTI